MNETVLTTRIKTHLRAHGWKVYKLHGGPMSQAGVPDLVAMKDGRTVWIEVKVAANKVTPLQQHEHDDIRNHGGEVWVIRSLDDLKKLLEEDEEEEEEEEKEKDDDDEFDADDFDGDPQEQWEDDSESLIGTERLDKNRED